MPGILQVVEWWLVWRTVAH